MLAITRSEQINEIAAALAKAQGRIDGAVKDRINPGFKSRYADLSSVWDSCRSALSENGIAIVQSPSDGEGGAVTMTTLMLHSSGQWIEGSYSMRPVKGDPQGIGSVITYARRYSLMAMVGIAPDDDDGNATSDRGDAEPMRQPRQPLPQVTKRPAQQEPPSDDGYIPTPEEIRARVNEIRIAIERMPLPETLAAYWASKKAVLAAIKQHDPDAFAAIEAMKNDRKAALAAA